MLTEYFALASIVFYFITFDRKKITRLILIFIARKILILHSDMNVYLAQTLNLYHFRA